MKEKAWTVSSGVFALPGPPSRQRRTTPQGPPPVCGFDGRRNVEGGVFQPRKLNFIQECDGQEPRVSVGGQIPPSIKPHRLYVTDSLMLFLLPTGSNELQYSLQDGDGDVLPQFVENS